MSRLPIVFCKGMPSSSRTVGSPEYLPSTHATPVLLVIDSTAASLRSGFIRRACAWARRERASMTVTSRRLPRRPERFSPAGVTTLLPTLASAAIPQLLEGLDAVREASVLPDMPRFAGAHLEGPYFSSAQRGAQSEAHLRDPADGSADALLSERSAEIRMVKSRSRASGGALALVERLVDLGIVAAAGHTDGTIDDLVRAQQAGLSPRDPPLQRAVDDEAGGPVARPRDARGIPGIERPHRRDHRGRQASAARSHDHRLSSARRPRVPRIGCHFGGGNARWQPISDGTERVPRRQRCWGDAGSFLVRREHDPAACHAADRPRCSRDRRHRRDRDGLIDPRTRGPTPRTSARSPSGRMPTSSI